MTGDFAFEDGGEGVDLASVVDYPPDAAVEAETPPAELEVDAQPWEGVSREEWEATQEQLRQTSATLEYLGGTLGEQEQAAQAEAEEQQWQDDLVAYMGDPADDGYEERRIEVQTALNEHRLQTMATAMVDERLTEYEPLLEWVVERQGQEAEAVGQARAGEILAAAGVQEADRQQAQDDANAIYRDWLKTGAAEESPEAATRALEAAARRITSRGGSLLDVAHRYTTGGAPASVSYRAPTPGLTPAMKSVIDRVMG